MLRIIVFSLLLANILFIALRMLQPPVDGPPVTVSPVEKTAALPPIELVSEQAALPGPRVAAEEPLPEESNGTEQAEERNNPMDPEAEPGLLSCIRIGPFGSENAMAGLASKLKDLFEVVQPRETQSIVDKGFWVFLPPYPSREEAELAVGRLSLAGVRELYVLPDGRMENAISLGVYNRKERAEARREQLNALGTGMDIVIESQTDIESEFWLEAGPVDALDPSLIELSLSHSASKQLQVPCPFVISEPRPDVAAEAGGAD